MCLSLQSDQSITGLTIMQAWDINAKAFNSGQPERSNIYALQGGVFPGYVSFEEQSGILIRVAIRTTERRDSFLNESGTSIHQLLEKLQY